MSPGRFSFLVLPFLASIVTAQALPADMEKLRFEVASVKPNKTGDPNSSLRLQPGGRIVAINVAVRLLIRNSVQRAGVPYCRRTRLD